MANKIILEIDMPSRESALWLYAYLIGANRYDDLLNAEGRFNFWGAAVPGPHTMFNPARVELKTDGT